MNHKKMGGLMSLFENHAGIMDQHSQEHNQQPISEKFVFVLIELWILHIVYYVDPPIGIFIHKIKTSEWWMEGWQDILIIHFDEHY